MTETPEPGKGQPTRSRKEAEAARKAQMKRPLTRKEQAARQRKLRNSQRDRQREALMGTGSPEDLPLRDRGPVRGFVRDFVDRRLTVAEFVLPILILIVIASLIRNPVAQTITVTLWMVTIIAVVIDESVLVLLLRRQLKARFEPGQYRGATMYAVLRSTQLRRMRLPKPTIERGGKLKEHY